ncbi:MAG: glycosyltransferase family 2 protein [Acidobacteriota bacterium]
MKGIDLVSVIVLSWNSMEFLPRCLESVRRQSHPRVELIVVDNGSSDGSARFVRESFPEAILVENTENIGFCAGNNAGLKRAGGAYILFLNADAILCRTYIEEALKPFRLDARIGMVAGKVHRFDGCTLDTVGQLLTRSRRIKERGYGEPDHGQFDRPDEVFSVCGAVALYKRELIESVSVDGEFFDEDFFAFGEDLDVGWRARRMAWRCYYQPSALARHFRGGTQVGAPDRRARRHEMIRRPPRIQAHIIKNRYLAMLKNETVGSFVVNLPFILAWDVVLWTYLLVFSPRTIRLVWGHRSLFGRALRKRRVMQSRMAPEALI